MQAFLNKKLREIRLWAWAAAVLPVASSATLFFIWAFGTDHLFKVAMISGASAMFTVAVCWWWWALHAIRTLTADWKTINESIVEVLAEIKEVRTLVRDAIEANSDK